MESPSNGVGRSFRNANQLTVVGRSINLRAKDSGAMPRAVGPALRWCDETR